MFETRERENHLAEKLGRRGRDEPYPVAAFSRIRFVRPCAYIYYRHQRCGDSNVRWVIRRPTKRLPVARWPVLRTADKRNTRWRLGLAAVSSSHSRRTYPTFADATAMDVRPGRGINELPTEWQSTTNRSSCTPSAKNGRGRVPIGRRGPHRQRYTAASYYSPSVGVTRELRIMNSTRKPRAASDVFFLARWKGEGIVDFCFRSSKRVLVRGGGIRISHKIVHSISACPDLHGRGGQL